MAKKKQVDSTTSSKPRACSHKHARAKGHDFERWIANELGHIFPEAKRQLEYQTDERKGTDIANTDVLKFQAKNKQNYVSVTTIEEIKIKNDNEIPVLVTKGNRQEPMAVLPFRKLVTLLEVVYGYRLPWRQFDEDDMPLLPQHEGPRTIVDHHIDAMAQAMADEVYHVQTGAPKPTGLVAMIMTEPKDHVAVIDASLLDELI